MLAGLAVGPACDEDAALGGRIDAGSDDERSIPPSAADSLTHDEVQRAVTGFDISISIQGEHVRLQWNLPPGGGFVAVYRSEDPRALLDVVVDEPLPPGVEEFPLAGNANGFWDWDAASLTSATPTYYYRVSKLQAGGMGQLFQYSTVVMKATTALHTGYSKVSMCMLDGPSSASELYASLDGTPQAIWGWDPVQQDYLHWAPADGAGAPTDFALELGQTASVQLGGGHPAYAHLVGRVPTTEAPTLSGEPGNNWRTVLPLFDGPHTASYWVDEAGLVGLGRWNNDTQSATWYWGAGDPPLPLEACQPYYVWLPDDVCASNDDCEGGFCSFVTAAACGERAVGRCTPFPAGCEGVPDDPVCGCDGQTYASTCEADLAGTSVRSTGACGQCGVALDFEDETNPSISGQTGGWQVYTAAPPSEDWWWTPFDSYVLGTDGNRASPYPGGETEASSVTVGPITLGSVLSFRSWHIDEGGVMYDRKRIEFETPDAGSWTLVDCTDPTDPPVFCQYRNDNRSGDDWDPIVLDTSALEGMTGNLRFEYDTVDGCCGFEQGWYIDDIGLGTCEPDPDPE